MTWNKFRFLRKYSTSSFRLQCDIHVFHKYSSALIESEISTRCPLPLFQNMLVVYAIILHPERNKAFSSDDFKITPFDSLQSGLILYANVYIICLISRSCAFCGMSVD